MTCGRNVHKNRRSSILEMLLRLDIGRELEGESEFKPGLPLNPLMPTVAKSTAIKHHVPDQVRPSFVIFDMRAIKRSAMTVRVPGCQKLQMMA